MRPPSSFETRPSGAPQDEADLANAPPPVSLAAPGKPYSNRRPSKNRGRAGRQGSSRTHGPRCLATSRLVEVLPVFALAPGARIQPNGGRQFALLRRSITRTALPCERGTSPSALTTTLQVTPINDLI